MKLEINIDGRPGRLELKGEGEEYRFRLLPEGGDGSEGSSAPADCAAGDGAGGNGAAGKGFAIERTASLIEAQPGIYSVLMNGRSFEVKILPGINGTMYVNVAGRHMAVEVRDPRAAVRKSGAARGEGLTQLSSPMPGKVMRVLVSEGDQVEAGQGVAVVEAMKMQNEVKAPRAGRVVSLAAKEGATVSAGEALAVLE